jgi:predicted esterase YcpF (UPF0227 family)
VTAVSTLIYLHGFLSSPLSAKALLTRDYLTRHNLPIELRVPLLPDIPEQALAAADAVVQSALAQGRVGLIGSSMGGYFSTILAERYDLRAVLVNPSAWPHRRIPLFYGEHKNPYTGNRFTLDASHTRWLQQMAPASLHPEHYWLLSQMGDEVLDYRDAVERYAGCRQTLEAGGNHQFVGFERYLPEVLLFLELTALQLPA